MPTLLDDLFDTDVAALAPAWLALVADELRRTDDVRRVAVHDRSLNLTWAGDVMLAVVHDERSAWQVRAMLLAPVSADGRIYEKFTTLGTLACDVDPGCGDVARMVGYLEALSDRVVLAEALAAAAGAPRSLIRAWAVQPVR